MPCWNSKTVNTAKYLGITLNIMDHIKIIGTKIACFVGILSQFSHHSPELGMLQSYYFIIHPSLLYRIAVRGNTFPTFRDELSRLQNKAFRLVTASNWNASAAPMFRNINVLPSSLLLKVHILV